MWSGHLHDSEFVSRVLEHVKENQDRYGTAMRMKGMLTLAKEVGDTCFFLVEPLLNLGFSRNWPCLFIPPLRNWLVFFIVVLRLLMTSGTFFSLSLPLCLLLIYVCLDLHFSTPVIPFLDPTHAQDRLKQRLLIVRSTTWSGAGFKWTQSKWKIWVRVRLHVFCWRKNLCKLLCLCVCEIVRDWTMDKDESRFQTPHWREDFF